MFSSLALSQGQDLQTIKERFLAEIFSQTPPSEDELNQWLKDLNSDGSFSSIDYKVTTAPTWGVLKGLSIAQQLILAYKTPGHSFYQNKKIKEHALKIIGFATSKEWDHLNWWHKEIGMPRVSYKLLFLLDGELNEHDKNYLMKLTRKGHISDHPSNWPATGQNLVWYAENTFALAVLFNQISWAQEARDAVSKEIEVGNRQGIQVDQSFYQHGKVFYNGGYGHYFSLDIASFFERVAGTKFAFSSKNYDVFSRYILDGQLYLIHGSVFDYSAKGREYARKSPKTAEQFRKVCQVMSRIKGLRQKEFKQCDEDLKNKNFAGKFGNKHFYRGDFMTHNRESFAISVKMHSERTLSGDTSPLGEGLKSHNLSDGLTYIYRDGSEYYDIFPVWDFTRAPGITFDYWNPLPSVPDHNYWPSRGLTEFVGGVSDGVYGAAVMDYKNRLLNLKKAWFFFDEGMVALGADISAYSSPLNLTSVNQEWSKGPVVWGKTPAEEMSIEAGKVETSEGSWAYSADVGYHFIKGKKIVIQNQDQKGSWFDLAIAMPKDEIKAPVANFWIEHEIGLKSDQYAYAVIPKISKEDFKKSLGHPAYEIISNTSEIQAVSFNKKLIQVIFHRAGKLNHNEVSISVNKPVALMVQKRKSDWKLSVSAPNQKVLDVKIVIKVLKKTKTFTIRLPQEELSGDSVKRIFKL